MKYKAEVWKYSMINAKDGEEHLNKMSEEGWDFTNALPILNLAFYKKRGDGQRQKYAIDVFYDEEGTRWKEEDGYLNFYRDLGWEYVMELGHSLKLFCRPYRENISPIYQNDEERRAEIKAHAKVPSPWLFILLILLWAAIFIYNYQQYGFLSTALLFIAFFSSLALTADSFITTLWLRGSENKHLGKLSQIAVITGSWSLVIIFIGLVLASWYGAFRGNPSFFAYAALPMAIGGIAVGAVRKNNALAMILILVAFFGTLFSLNWVLQL